MKITIDKGVKMPEKVYYPFKELKVGQSFEYGAYTSKLHHKAGSHCFYYSNKKDKKKFVCRKDDKGVLRIWRVK